MWMAVTADEYELPLVVEETQEELAEKMGVKKETISKNAWKYKHGKAPMRKRGPRTKFGLNYRVVHVDEID